MKILYVVGCNLCKNTSANMSHNGYIQGLLEKGFEVDIIMANDSWGETDNTLKKWDNAIYYEYNSISIADTIKKFIKNILPKSKSHNNNCTSTSFSSIPDKNDDSVKKISKKNIREILNSLFYAVFKNDPVYPLNSKWLKEASKYKNTKMYDIVISNSSPAASHKLVSILTHKKRIKYKKWIQIWEDPWYYDIYSSKHEDIKKEEYYLLKEAEDIYYVSPLTLHYQKKHFPNCAHKMKFIPLPFFKYEKGNWNNTNTISFGYFGDYYSHTRNLKPFYDAIIETNSKCYICGDSDLNLQETDLINISGRITLEKLEKIQDKTSVLIHLCNIGGGQIPGKIYHYSATEKPIIFILDGTSEEQKIIKSYFEKYNRYYFCKNNKDDIKNAILDIKKNYELYKGEVVTIFEPRMIIENILQQSLQL